MFIYESESIGDKVDTLGPARLVSCGDSIGDEKRTKGGSSREISAGVSLKTEGLTGAFTEYLLG